MSIVICHHNDLDGFCSAAVAYRELKLLNKNEDVILIEMDYDRELPTLPNDTNKIFVLDFSFRDNKFDELIVQVGRDNVIWLDHHESVIRTLTKYADLPGCRTDEYSGAMLTWRYFHVDDKEECPYVVKLTDDYDRWIMKYDEDTLNFYEYSLGIDLENINSFNWDMLLSMTDFGIKNIIEIGKELRLRRHRELSDHINEAGQKIKIIWEGKEYSCIKINTTFTRHTSQLGAIVYSELGYDLFWGYYFKVSQDGKVLKTNQLRSVVVDVSRIAQAYGGGGHINAAGWNDIMVGCDREYF